jgi:hypothetical protein
MGKKRLIVDTCNEQRRRQSLGECIPTAYSRQLIAWLANLARHILSSANEDGRFRCPYRHHYLCMIAAWRACHSACQRAK